MITYYNPMLQTPTATIIQMRIKDVKKYLLEFDYDAHPDWYVDDFIVANTRHRKLANTIIQKRKSI